MMGWDGGCGIVRNELGCLVYIVSLLDWVVGVDAGGMEGLRDYILLYC